ncbi:hypothetical protein H632_c582p1, partial [Helicosporidium sp. ATCC 50920]
MGDPPRTRLGSRPSTRVLPKKVRASGATAFSIPDDVIPQFGLSADKDVPCGAAVLPSATRAGIMQSVDRFVMSLPLGATQGDAAVEEAVTAKLYRAELSRAEAQLQLGEWCVLWG